MTTGRDRSAAGGVEVPYPLGLPAKDPHDLEDASCGATSSEGHLAGSSPHEADEGSAHRAADPSSPPPYEPVRDSRFHYAHDAIAHIEQVSCGQGAGCAHAGRRVDVLEHGAGGTCGILAGLFLGEVQADVLDHGDRLECTAYRERTVKRRGKRTPPGQTTLEDVM